MPLVTNITWTNLPQILAFALVVWGVANALYRSYLAQEVMSFMHRNPDKAVRLKRLQFEVGEMVALPEDAEPGKPSVQVRRLTQEEYVSKYSEMMDLARGTRWYRTVMYLLGCAFCQHLQISLIVTAVFAEWKTVALYLATSVLYASLATVCFTKWTITVQRFLQALMANNKQKEPPARPKGSTCGGYGS